MEKTKWKTGGIAKFIDEAKRYRDDPTVLNNIIEAMSEKIDELQAKATAYDRVMSGGKKTLKELANFLGMNVAVEDEPIYGRRVFASPTKMFLKTNPTIYGSYTFWALSETGTLFQLPPNLIDFNDDWKDSLTLPDGWEEK